MANSFCSYFLFKFSQKMNKHRKINTHGNIVKTFPATFFMKNLILSVSCLIIQNSDKKAYKSILEWPQKIFYKSWDLSKSALIKKSKTRLRLSSFFLILPAI